MNENNACLLLDEDFVVVQQLNKEWPNIFRTYFLSKTTRLPQITTGATSDDDLVFYVTKKIDDNSQSKSKYPSKYLYKIV